MINTINISDHIEFSTNTVTPDVYTNVHHKLLCLENSEQMLLNSTQIDWQEAYLKNIEKIPELSDAFRLNTTEELLWIIDRLVAQIFRVIPKSLTVSQKSTKPTYTGANINVKNYLTVKYTEDGVEQTITDYVVSPDNLINATTGTQVTVTYNELTQNCNFVINKKTFKITTNAQTTSAKNNIDQSKYTTTDLINGHTLTNVVLSVNTVNNVDKIVVSSYDIVDSNNNSVKSNYTLNQTNGTWTQETSQVTYYWYVGQTDPSSLTEIPQNDIVNDTSSPGWRLIGETLPTYSSSNQLWDGTRISTGTTKQTNYVALPNNTLFMYDSLGNISDAGWISAGTTEINGITYYIYSSVANLKSFTNNIY